MSLTEDFINLIFPNICACCGNSLWKHEKVICTFCDFHLPRTNFHLERDNPVSRTFWGRVQIESAAALYYFNKGNRVQTLIHQLKYKGRKDIGNILGEKYGAYLKHSPFFNTVETIIPVPLHKKKRMKRGYNQSEEFANGLGKSMKCRVDLHSLVRSVSNETQTRKSRYRRWQNVKDTFTVAHPEQIQGKHLLLVDDVITTGATLEACLLALSAVPGVKISIATIAFANR
jgi:ComF family protein